MLIWVLKIIAVVALLGVAAAISTPKDRLPLALRGIARIMRKELHKRGIENVRVIYSREPAHAENTDEQTYSRRPVPASAAFCVPAAGILAAAEAVKLLLK